MEIVKSVFQSKGKRYQFIRYCTVGTLAAGRVLSVISF